MSQQRPRSHRTRTCWCMLLSFHCRHWPTSNDRCCDCLEASCMQHNMWLPHACRATHAHRSTRSSWMLRCEQQQALLSSRALAAAALHHTSAALCQCLLGASALSPQRYCRNAWPTGALTRCMLRFQEDARPEPCNENLIINELIREYLIFNGYRDTLSVFLPGGCA